MAEEQNDTQPMETPSMKEQIKSCYRKAKEQEAAGAEVSAEATPAALQPAGVGGISCVGPTPSSELSCFLKKTSPAQSTAIDC